MDLSKLSILELRSLRDNCNKWISLKAQSNAMSFTIGQEVTVDHKKLRGEVCEVVKVNRSMVVLDTPSMGKVSVAMSLVMAS